MGNQSKDKLETIVRYTLDRMLEDSALRLFIAKLCFGYYEDSKSDDKGAYLESLKSKLKDVEGKLQNFVRAIGAGIFNETVQQAMSELESQKHLLKEQIEAEELRERYAIKLDTIVKYFESFVGNLDDKRLHPKKAVWTGFRTGVQLSSPPPQESCTNQRGPGSDHLPDRGMYRTARPAQCMRVKKS